MIQTLVSLNETGSDIQLHIQQDPSFWITFKKESRTYLNAFENMLNGWLYACKWLLIDDIKVVMVKWNIFFSIESTHRSVTDFFYATLWLKKHKCFRQTYLNSAEFVPLFEFTCPPVMNENKELFPTEHVIGHVNLNVPLAVEHHLALDALVGLLL